MKTSPFALALALVFGAGLTASSLASSGLAPLQKKPSASKPKKPSSKVPAAIPTIKATIDVYLVEGGKLTGVKDGQALAGSVTFRVKVAASSPVSSVEFYVGDDLRDTDGSTPYEFKFDALTAESGDVKLTFKGYTSSGGSATKVLNLKVDNGGGMSLAEHLQRGNEALTNSKDDDALTEGRIALKMAPDSVEAKLLIARAYLGKNVYDLAQRTTNEILEKDPKNVEALQTSAAIGVQRAFLVTNSGSTNRDESLKTIEEALGGAVDARSKVDDLRFDAMNADAAKADPAGYADAAFGAGRYGSAINALEPAFQADTKNTALGNRLVYAHLMNGDPGAANTALNLVMRYGKPDAYSYALQGLLRAEAGDEKGADESFKNGALEDPESLGLRTAQASVALKKNRPQALQNISNGLAKDVASRPEVNYYLAAVSARLQRYDISRRNFEAAVRIDPANDEMYLEQGSQALSLATNARLSEPEKKYNLQSARTMFNLALRAKPNSAYALSGLAIVSILQGKPEDAEKSARAAVAAGPNVPVAHFTLSGALSERRKSYLARITSPDPAVRAEAKSGEESLGAESRSELAKAGVLDRANLSGRLVPDGEAAFAYLSTSGRQPVLTPPARG